MSLNNTSPTLHLTNTRIIQVITSPTVTKGAGVMEEVIKTTKMGAEGEMKSVCNLVST